MGTILFFMVLGGCLTMGGLIAALSGFNVNNNSRMMLGFLVMAIGAVLACLPFHLLTAPYF